MNLSIRPATSQDFDQLYLLGQNTPELRVSSIEPFMDRDEFEVAIKNSSGLFLLVEVDSSVAGFIYASGDDKDKPIKKKWACLVYLVVAPKWRGNRVATQLYDSCIAKLKENGITHLYSWVDTEGDGAILSFMKKRGFTAGHTYQWMDREL